LPRKNLPSDHGANLAIQYAKELNLEPVIVYARKEQLINALIKGYGDVIASTLLISEQRSNQIAFSHPLTYAYQQLIRAKGPITPVDKITGFTMENLEGMRIGVQKSEVYWQTVQKLQNQYKQLQTIIVPDKMTPDELLDFMIQGDYETTISDSQQMQIALNYRNDIEVVHTIKEKNPVAWGIRKDNPELLDSINSFIENYRLTNSLPASFIGDFDQQKKKSQLRLITWNEESSYFLWKNKLMGFEYDLIKKFALDHGLSLKVLVANDFEQMLKWLQEGRGDIVSASLDLSEKRIKLPVLFTKPYRQKDGVFHWMVRKNNPLLAHALDAFIKKYYKGTFYNVTYNKYFKNSKNSSKNNFTQQMSSSQISPYDNLIKKFSKQYKFNWLLISAQINQESKFDPNAKSWAGAKGLMQIMPKTAKKLQISNLQIPKNAIAAGVKYMHWIRNRFNKDMPVEDKNWFSLAAYNAGIGHVQDARKLAKELNLDPDRWFDHTEKAMLLLAQKKYARKARYGFVRGSETVFYVKQVRHIFNLYQLAVKRNS